MTGPRPARHTARRDVPRLVAVPAVPALALAVLTVFVLAATALVAPAAGALRPFTATVAASTAALRDPGPSIGRQIDAAVDEYLRTTGVSGAQLSVIGPGATRSTAYGTDESGAAVTVDRQSGLASITKTFTSALVLQSADRGLIDLDAPLPALAALPDFPVQLGITPRHLLMHRSGLATYRDTPAYQADPAAVSTPQAAVEAALEVPLAFEPGAGTAYSSTNFLVLGFLLEQATGRSYDDLLRTDLLVPLGLDGVTHAPPEPGEPNFSTSGVAASADETARWLHQLVIENGAGLEPASLDTLRVVAGPDRFTGGGLWGYCPCTGAWSGVGHSGSTGIVEAWPDDGVTIAFMATTQLWNPPGRYLAAEALLVTLHRIATAGGKVPAGERLRIRVGAPNTTVIGTLTVTEPTTAGYATVHPCAAALPPTSNINFAADQTVANLVVATTDANGDLCITPSTATHLLYDLAVTTDTITPQTPARLADSRRNPKPTPTTAVRIRVGAPNTTVIGTLTVTEPTTAGYATVHPCAAALPPTSNINFAADQTVANLVVATTDANGDLCITPSTATHLLYDLAVTTDTITPQTPARLADSRRNPKPTPTTAVRIRVGAPNTTVIGTLTVTEPTTAGYATVHPCAAALPPTSNINFAADQTVANLVVATTDANGDLCITPSTATHLLYDLAVTTDTITPQTPARLADSR